MLLEFVMFHFLQAIYFSSLSNIQLVLYLQRKLSTENFIFCLVFKNLLMLVLILVMFSFNFSALLNKYANENLNNKRKSSKKSVKYFFVFLIMMYYSIMVYYVRLILFIDR